ncbi:hypothetical protein, partial [Streptomyces sp. NPDC048551]|uniref:hypothetical protein n=1 Tax=Streptomyces sp. NPDC048551 TaxID=3155758 RepID=UPI003414386B
GAAAEGGGAEGDVRSWRAALGALPLADDARRTAETGLSGPADGRLVRERAAVGGGRRRIAV